VSGGGDWSRICVTDAGGLLYLICLPQVPAALGPDEARRARAEGQAMTIDEAVADTMEGRA
jgi:hypothetical protein